MTRLLLVLSIAVICFVTILANEEGEGTEGETEGVTEGVTERVTEGETEGETKGVTEGVTEVVTEGVTGGTSEGSIGVCVEHEVPEEGSSGDQQENRQVFYKESLIAIINENTQTGVILDYFSGLIVVLNGKRSSLIVEDIYKQVRYFLENEAETVNIIWSNVEDYFQKLSSLQSLLGICQEKGKKSRIDTIEESVRNFLNEAFDGLDGSSPILEDLSYPTKFIEQLRGCLSLVYKGSGSFRIASGLDEFTQMNLAVAELLNYSEGKLTLENVDLNATQIFNSESGAEVLLNVLSQAGVHFDLTKVFRGLFTSRENILSLLKSACSGSYYGVDGLLRILVNYAELSIGSGSTDELISSVLNYNAGSGDIQNLNSLINEALAIAANQDGLFHNAQGLSVFVSIWNGIISSNQTSHNISVSAIITLLTSSGSSYPLSILVKVLSSFYQALNMPDSFGSIAKQFNQTLDGGSTAGNSDVQLIYKTSLMAIVNKSAKMAMLVDYSSQLIAEFNGKQSSIQVVDISEEIRYFLKIDSDMESSIWSDFEGYFQQLESLEILLKIGQEKGEKSSKYTLEESVRVELEEVFNCLGVSSPLPDVLQLVIKFIKQLKGSLSLVYRGSGSFRIAGGLEEFIKENLAVAELLSYSEGNSDLQVFYKPSLIAVVNETAKMAVIFDYSSRLMVEHNGKQGIINVIDLSKQVRYIIKNSIWSNFEEFFQKLPSLKPLLEKGQKVGEMSKLGTIGEPLRKTLEELYKSLGIPSPMLNLLTLYTEFIDSFEGPLSLVYKGSGSFRIAKSIDSFTKMNLAVAGLLTYSEGKLSTENFNLNAMLLFKAGSGAEVLLNVLSQVGVRFDLTKIFVGLFTSREKVLSLLKIASSGSHDGVDGLLRILVNYAEISIGSGSIDQLITSVLNYNAGPDDGRNLISLFKQKLAVIANQDNIFHNAAGFSGYVSILNSIVDNNRTSKNIKISDIITLLTSTIPRNPLSTLVNVLSSFYQALNISDPFGSITRKFNQTLDGGLTTGNSDLQLIYKTSLIAIFNKSANMSVIFDYYSQLIVEFNGKQGTINVAVISEQVRYFLKNEADTVNNIWSNFEEYFQKLSSLKYLLEIGKQRGDKSKLDTLEEPVRGNLQEVFNSLGISSPLPKVLSLLTKFVKQLKGSLSLVYKGRGSFSIAGGLEGFIKVNLAVAESLVNSAVAESSSYTEGNAYRQVFYKPSLLALINESARMCGILDYSSRLIVDINGKLGTMVLIDVSKQLRYYMKIDTGTANSIFSNFQNYFQKLSSLQSLLEIIREKGDQSSLDTPPREPFRETVEGVFEGLGGSPSLSEQLSIFTKILDALQGPLSLIYKGNGSFRISFGMDTFDQVNLAVAELLNYSTEKLSLENLNLNVMQIFKAESGAEVLLNVLSQAGVRFDLTKVFRGLFTSRENILNLLKSACSGSYNGLDGLLSILVNYAELSNGMGKIDQLISSVLNYNPRPGDAQSFSSLVNQLLTIAASQDKLFQNASEFSTFVSILSGLTNNVGLSKIITLLTSSSSRNPLNFMVNVLSSLSQALNIEDSFGSIVRQFNQTLDGGSTAGISVIYKPPLIAIVNKTAKMAVIVDYASQLIVEFNGKRATIQVVDLTKQIRYHLKNTANEENRIWSNFNGYFQKMSSLQYLLKIGQKKGETSNTSDLQPVREEAGEVFNSLGLSSPLPDVLSLLTKFVKKLKDSLSLVYKGSGSFSIAGGLEGFIKVNLAVAESLVNSAVVESSSYTEGNADRQVFYKPSLIALINESARMCWILDYYSRLIVDINGKLGTMVLIDVSKQLRYYMKIDTSTANSIFSNFQNYFQKLSSLQSLLEIIREKGDQSSLDTPPREPFRETVEGVFEGLGGSSSLSEQVSIFTKILDALQGPLSLIYKGNGSFRISFGMDTIDQVNLAVAELLNYSTEKLSLENLNLNVMQIFKAESGAEVLLNVLSQAGVRFHLTKVFRGLFTSRENILSLLKSACSGSYNGLDGLLSILVNYAELSNGMGKIDQLISSVLNYNPRPGDAQSLNSLVNQLLTIVASQDKLFQNAPEFSTFVSILSGFIDNNQITNNVSLPKLITLLTSTIPRNPLSTPVNVLSSFYRALNISDPFGSITKKFNQTLDGGSTTGNSDLQLIYKTSLIAIFNKSANMSVIFDYYSQLIVEFNGKQGTINVAVISEQVRYFLKNEADTVNNIWSNFEEYFQKLSSLKYLLEIGKQRGDKSKLDTLEEPVRGNLQEVFNSLGISSPLPKVLSLLTKFVKQLKGSLSLVYKGSGSFSIVGGLEGFIKVNLAVAESLVNSAVAESSSYTEGNADRQVFYKPSLIAFINETAKMAIIFDYSSRLMVEHNGKQGVINVVDISKQVRYTIKNSTWSNFEGFFQKLWSLQSLLKTGQEEGEMTKLDTIAESLHETLKEVYKSLGVSSTRLELISLFTKFIDLFKGSLFLVYTGSGSFSISFGIESFTKMNLAVAELLNYSKGKLSHKKVNLSAAQIFKAESGAEVLLKVLSQAGVRTNLFKEFRSLFTSSEKILSLLKSASSGSYNGLDGLLMILVNYAELLIKKGSTDQLIYSALNYNSRPNDGQSLSSLVSQALTVVANQDRHFHNARKFSVYVSIWNSFIANNSPTYSKISISNIITLLTSRSSRNPLSSMVKVLSSIYQALNIKDSFGSISSQFNQTLDGGSTLGNSDVQVMYKHYLIAIVSESAKMAVIFDYSSRINAEYNGKQGTIQVVDISEEVRYSLKNDADMENSIWSNFEGYFQKMSSLQFLLKIGREKGEKSNEYTLEESVRVDLQELFNCLGISSPLPEVLQLLNKFIEQFNGLLSLVYKGSGSFGITGGLEGFIKVNQAVAELLNSEGGTVGEEAVEGGKQDCETGGKGGVVLQWGPLQAGKGGVKKLWKRRGPFHAGIGNGGGKGNCRRGKGKGKGSFGIGVEIGDGSLSVDVGGKTEVGNWGGSLGAQG